MRYTLFLLLLVAIALAPAGGCAPATEDVPPPDLLAQACGGCHLPPAPTDLPRAIWERRVLPEMGARLGFPSLGYDPAAALPPGEHALAVAHGFYPEVPTLSYDAWHDVRAYILDRAPDTLAAPPRLRLDSLRGFTVKPFSVEDRGGSLVSFLGAGPAGLLSGSGYGELAAVDPDGPARPVHNVRLPVVHYQADSAGDLLLEIGNIYPTEASNGTLYRYIDGVRTVVADSLHRPVHFLAEDLDGDGRQEIVVCEYGNYTGALTLLRPRPGGGYVRSRLLGAAGTLRVEATDLDGDGRKDLLVLHAQGDEGIDALYQEANGSFRREPLLQFPPVWGTSWFEFVDVDGDGDRDLLTVHGDNADYSPVIKPYHGLRIYTNDGENHFTEAFFLPLPGATRVAARDFDADGDLDLAVACNFADFVGQPEASFVYLERTGTPKQFNFHLRTTALALDGRWLILEAGDYDGDGDEDLALGSFTLNPASVPDSLNRRWREGTTDGLLLENRLR
ncbi:FG-GAP repeat domain-containing protein [Lewinella sp. IMCC34183]|uniref:FG-GAP repeat domain-containing protein n=1 Tax=Lewinella sp. IMCC34183 TaxID=2248762 RepID=UPI000E2400EF|nr:VCBS repeat-containing protein [Lewinella sp. IMCC34183]